MGPVIGATQSEVAVAIANVVLYGTIGLLIYPYIMHSLIDTYDSAQIGSFLGLAIHDTSQVMGAALAYDQMFTDELVVQMATITKLSRNLFLAVAVPVFSWLHRNPTSYTDSAKHDIKTNHTDSSVIRRFWIAFGKVVPLFILGFVGASVVRSIGEDSMLRTGLAFGIMKTASWKGTVDFIGNTMGSQYLLGYGLNHMLHKFQMGIKHEYIYVQMITCTM